MIDEAILTLIEDPRYARQMYDAYISADLRACAQRFWASGEFAEVVRHLGERARGELLDLGAGNGIASYAFAQNGARLVYALEPSKSKLVGQDAIATLTCGLSVEIFGGVGEEIPLPDGSVDVVYARQVLHHTADLRQVLKECHRVLRSGGLFLACREHVVDNEAQLRSFLANHPIHRQIGGENAFPLSVYLDAITGAKLQMLACLGPWDSVINAYPGVTTQAALDNYSSQFLGAKLGPVGNKLGGLSPVRQLVWRWLNRPVAGRLYTFLAAKP
jgi:ubiquinone/menaquinone biosynthesis C-methylase UbiE